MSPTIVIAISLLGAAQAAAPHGGADDAITVVPADAAPVTFVSSRYEKEAAGSDYLVTFRNTSKKDVRFVEYVLGWPECPGERTKPLPPIISYGTRSGEMNAPALRPGEEAVVKIAGKTLQNMARWAKRHRCGDTARPALALMKVGFGDGAQWASP